MEGLNKISGIPEILVSDEKTRKFLEEKNYIVDIRIPNDEIEDTDEHIQTVKRNGRCSYRFVLLNSATRRRLSLAFLPMWEPGFVEYMARSEIQSYAALKENSEFMPSGGEKSWVHEHLEEHFTALDNNIRKLYEELNPDHFIITADHNIVPGKHRANANGVLSGQKIIGWLRRFPLVY